MKKSRYSRDKTVESDPELNSPRSYSQNLSSPSYSNVQITVDSSLLGIARQIQTSASSSFCDHPSSSTICSCCNTSLSECKKVGEYDEIQIDFSSISSKSHSRLETSPSSDEQSTSSSCSCCNSCPSNCEKEYDCCDRRESCYSETIEGIACQDKMECNRSSILAIDSVIGPLEDDQRTKMDLFKTKLSKIDHKGDIDGLCRKESILGQEIETLENSNLIERARPERLPTSTTQIGSPRSARLEVSRTVENDVISRRPSCGVSINVTRTNSTGTLFDTSLSETDLRYTNKDLSEYLGMKDQISKSIVQHEVYIFRYITQILCFK